MTQASTSVLKTVTVAVSQERAFEVYTAGFGTWWPKEHHIGEAEMATCGFEPKVGGRWGETGVDGSTCDWGHVLVWDPPNRLVHTWQLQGDWKYDPDPAKASEVEIRFVPEGPNRTRVELEHRLFERHGSGADRVRDGVSAPKGFEYCLSKFAEAVGAAG
ncbi:MAG TPA: SRPBCC family protein [Pseudonocardiaceae bacterium]|nr:SRPBCC family protein [Pseudonocardiaceae bacterium]